MKAVVLLVLLAACDQGKKDSPGPPVPAPMGIIKGRVTFTMNGPGRAHAPSESFSRTTGLECKVIVIDQTGNTVETKTRADGGYELSVPIGHYEVSFDACRDDRSCGVRPPKPVDVATGVPATADWDCEMDAK